MKADEINRKHATSNVTLYKRQSKYGGMDVTDARRLRELEEESNKLKKLPADTILILG